MKKIKYWTFPVLWAGVIFTLSALRVHKVTQFDLTDFIIKKTAHVVEYAIFFLLLYRAFLNTTSFGRRKAALSSLVVVFLYAVSDEYHQSFTPGREPRLRDVVIDTFGGGVSWLGIWKLLPKMPKRLASLARELEIH